MGLTVTLAGAVATFVVAVAAGLTKTEIEAWAPRAALWVKDFALRPLPRHLRERFAEEWASHLDDMPGPISKLIVAVGFYFASTQIGASHILRRILLRVGLVSCAMSAAFAASLVTGIMNGNRDGHPLLRSAATVRVGSLVVLNTGTAGFDLSVRIMIMSGLLSDEALESLRGIRKDFEGVKVMARRRGR